MSPVTDSSPQRMNAMETLAFILHNLPAIGERTLEHVSIVSVAVGFAILTGVPLGIAITQSQRAADTVLYLGSIVMTIPSIALFGVLIPLLSKIGQGIGYLPAVIAAMLYAQLPIMRNTYTAIRNVDPALRSAAIGMGMSPSAAPRARRDPDRAAGHHRRRPHRGRHQHRRHRDCRRTSAPADSARSSRAASRRRTSGSCITGALALGLLAIAADYALLWLSAAG